MARAMPFVLLACVLAIALLAVRVVLLENQLERAERRLGSQTAAKASTEATLEPVKPVGLEPRLTAVEQQLRALREELQTLEKATETSFALPAAVPGADPRQILSVVKGESDRIRDRQIDFARKSWSAGRKAALDQFAIAQKLESEQREQIDELLESENDKLEKLLRRPDLLENPEQTAADWNAVLRDTDRAASGVLDAQQVQAWTLARTIERRVLWPWLPQE